MTASRGIQHPPADSVDSLHEPQYPPNAARRRENGAALPDPWDGRDQCGAVTEDSRQPLGRPRTAPQGRPQAGLLIL
jgi:hypothetical protein